MSTADGITITEVPVEHAGWRCYTFEVCGALFKLTTIAAEGEEPHSLLSLLGKDSIAWTNHRIVSFKGVLDPRAAVEIVRVAASQYTRGHEAGRRAQQADTRKVLGL